MVGALAAVAALVLALFSTGVIGRRVRPRRPALFGFLSRRRANRGPRQRPGRRWLILAAVFAVAAVTVIEGLRISHATQDLYRGTTALDQAAQALGTNPSGWTPDRLDQAKAGQVRALALLRPADDVLRTDPLVRFSRHLPYIGVQTSSAVILADTSVQSAYALDDFITVGRDYSSVLDAEPGRRLLTLLNSAAGPLADADRRLAPSVGALRQIKTDSLIAPLRRRVKAALDRLGPLDATAAVAATAGRYAPAALGAYGPRTYLLVLENPAELRPNGGFAGALGSVTLDNGTANDLTIKDESTYSRLVKKPLPVPYPLGRYLTFYKNSLELGDAGWDPDFPTSARTTEALFNSATGTTVDGTIAVDPYAIEALLRVTGPVNVPGYGTFSGQNFYDRLESLVNASTAPGSGKAALPVIGESVLAAVLKAPAGSWPQLLQAFQTEAGQRHIQVAMHDPALASAAAAAHYDGALLNPTGDYAMVVDANVGATKGDSFVHKSMGLQIQVDRSGVARHLLSLSYEMPAPVDQVDRTLNPGDGSYRDYLRVYLPEDAAIASFTYTLDGGSGGQGSLDAVGFDHGRRYVGIYIQVPRGHTGRVQLAYQVSTDPGAAYALYLQKQAGVPGAPATVELSAPGVHVVQTSVLDHDKAYKF